MRNFQVKKIRIYNNDLKIYFYGHEEIEVNSPTKSEFTRR